MKNRVLKKCYCWIGTLIVSSYFWGMSSIAVYEISDPMLIKAINLSLKEEDPKRQEMQKIVDEDIPNVLKLHASGLDITDISGLEQFTNIQSTIDLSNNRLIDIKPLIDWVKNKNDPDLKANIFIGGNPILEKDNYKQVYELSNMGPNIRIYDYQREGEGVIELIGFINGKPVDDMEFDDLSSNANDEIEVYRTKNSIVNTGTTAAAVYIAAFSIILFILLNSYRKRTQQ